MKLKEIIINLHGVKNENDIVYRFYKALNYFPHVSEEERKDRVKKNNYPVSWDAFSDNLSSFYFAPGYLEGPKPEKLTLIVKESEDIKKMCLR